LSAAIFKRGIGLLVLLCLIPGGWAAAGDIGIVQAYRLNMRAGPGLQHPVVLTLKQDETVEVLKVLGEWVNISYHGREGFVKNRPRYIRLFGDRAHVSGLEKDAADIRRTIQEKEKAVRVYSRKESDVLETLDAIDRKLHEDRQQIQQLRRDLEQLQAAIQETETAIRRLSDRIRIREVDAGRRLAALYKLNWLGSIHFLASADSIYELFQRETALERVLDQDRNLLDSLARDKEGRHRLLQTQRRQMKAKSTLQEALSSRLADMEKNKAERKALLSEIRSQKSLQLASISALKAFSRELNETIEKLRKKAPETTGSAEPTGGGIADRKGLLPLPVNGKIITRFGPFRNEDFNVMNFRSGIDIQADRGEPVRAVHSGKVLYAGWFKGYGNMIIIDHGQGYYSVYANNQELFKKEGNAVEAGEVIATVGDTGSSLGPKLYFELRYRGKPVDPMDWIRQG
jgi:septal ring factor EnvC (AmiA/AmiB activator)